MSDEKTIPRPPGQVPPKPPELPVPLPPPKRSEEEVVIVKEKVYMKDGEYVPLPSAVDVEESVLGAVLIDGKAFEEIFPILSIEVFYYEPHKAIYRAFLELYEKQIPIDLKTVSDELSKLGKLKQVGGNYYLVQLTQKIFSAAHIEFHARIVLQKYIQRELIRMSRYAEKKAYDANADVFKLLENIEIDIERILSIAVKKSRKQDNKDAQAELLEKISRSRSGETPGVYTGIEEFDDWSGGFLYRELITIAARPGMGKTSAMLSMSSRASFEKDTMVGMFSLEMSKTDLVFRVAARLTGIPYELIRKGKLTDEEKDKILAAIRTIEDSKLKIFDTSTHKNVLENIIKQIRDLVKQGCKIVFIDYVQLTKLSRASSDRTSDLSTITRELKALANELNIPIVQFAQLNRDVDKRPGHMPVLSDLKQSGSIEEDSDTVIFLLRPAYYQMKETPGLQLPKKIIGGLRFIVAKGRNIGVRSFDTFIDFDTYTLSSSMKDEVEF